jgi:uncharacterized protein YceH (UPF0502 family)
MSTEQTPPPASPSPPPESWPVLELLERRVLGVLIEKGKTTPDSYPLSLNALVTGCNQKTNRDPLLDLEDVEVEETLGRLQKKDLVLRVVGGRVERWRHTLYDEWKVGKVELAILGELLLRGPQTEGELRGRAGRMEPIDDLDTLKTALRPLVQRKLVVYLTAEDRRGAMLTHGFHNPEELEGLRRRHAGGSTAAEAAPSRPAPVRESEAAKLEGTLRELQGQLAEARQEIAALKQTVAELQANATALRGELQALKQSLGAG